MAGEPTPDSVLAELREISAAQKADRLADAQRCRDDPDYAHAQALQENEAHDQLEAIGKRFMEAIRPRDLAPSEPPDIDVDRLFKPVEVPELDLGEIAREVKWALAEEAPPRPKHKPDELPTEWVGYLITEVRKRLDAHKPHGGPLGQTAIAMRAMRHAAAPSGLTQKAALHRVQRLQIVLENPDEFDLPGLLARIRANRTVRLPTVEKFLQTRHSQEPD